MRQPPALAVREGTYGDAEGPAPSRARRRNNTRAGGARDVRQRERNLREALLWRAAPFFCAQRIFAGLPILDIRTLFHHLLNGIMADKKLGCIASEAKSTAKVYLYPAGTADIVCSTSFDFGQGWEIAKAGPVSSEAAHRAGCQDEKQSSGRKCADPEGEDMERSMRRARSKVRRLALANDFRWFVTLTLDPSKVDTMDGAAVVKKLNAWASNMVQRHELRYILVPERHKKGGIHFHGFFSDCLKAVDSGHLDRQGHKIYNLPQWSLGFTTAIELYDDYTRAVGYVCKYIGKQGEKPAGRWYYSGGQLAEPKCLYFNLSYREIVEKYKGKVYTFEAPGRGVAVVNGLKLEEAAGLADE